MGTRVGVGPCHLPPGERERWPILRSNLDGKPFKRLLKPLVAQTHLPVIRVKPTGAAGKSARRRTAGHTKARGIKGDAKAQ